MNKRYFLNHIPTVTVPAPEGSDLSACEVGTIKPTLIANLGAIVLADLARFNVKELGFDPKAGPVDPQTQNPTGQYAETDDDDLEMRRLIWDQGFAYIRRVLMAHVSDPTPTTMLTGEKTYTIPGLIDLEIDYPGHLETIYNEVVKLNPILDLDRTAGTQPQATLNPATDELKPAEALAPLG